MGNWVTTMVELNGIEFSTEQQGMLEALQRPAAEAVACGQGITLSIARQLIELHGGKISIIPQPGGSQLTFTLHATDMPAARKAASYSYNRDQHPDYQSRYRTDITRANSRTNSRTNSHTNTHANSTAVSTADKPGTHPTPTSADNDSMPSVAPREHAEILVVDDDPVNCQVLLNHLSLAKYNAHKSESGIDALRMINEGQQFDLLILDVMMPRLSGFDVCKEIRKSYSSHELPIIILTANNRVEDMVMGFESGANDFITKPITKQELLSRVNTHLQLLEVNRHLEEKVMQRTTQLQDALSAKNRDHEMLQQAQTQLVQSEKMASLGTLVAGVAHEINNPINFTHASIYNLTKELNKLHEFINLMAGGDADQEIISAFDEKFAPIHEHIHIMNDGTKRIMDLVKDLRFFAPAEQPEMREAELAEGLRSTLNLVKAQYRDHIEFELNIQYNPLVLCHPEQLNQVYLNLMINACQAMQDDQQPGKTKRLTIETRRENDSIMITFRDTGPGISEEHKPRVFEPFYTTKPVGRGTGLGLSISYGIVKEHKGEIDIETQLGVGTSMIIILPA